MGLQHPEVTKIMQTGYPSWAQEPQVIGEDSLGNDIHVGDSIYVLDDEVFVCGEITQDAIDVLEVLGAIRTRAK